MIGTRPTTTIDGDFVVFLIGMRINRPLQVWKWLPVARAMGRMLKTLFQHPEKGFLPGQVMFYWKGVGVIQYWGSFEDLERFAHSPDEPHRGPWQRFNRAVGSGGKVGIWHETYAVRAGRYESVYGNMPVFGLAAASTHVPATDRLETARLRMGN